MLRSQVALDGCVGVGTWFRPFVVVAIAMFAGIAAASAQDTPPNGGATPEYAVRTLEHLRSGQLEEALITLGQAADIAAEVPRDQVSSLAAAAAGIHLALQQRDPAEQYDLLYEWTMPVGDRPAIRTFTTPVPRSVPPRVFARVLGERPSDDFFKIASVGEIEGLFSTGWMLVRAADDVGRLTRLVAELETLSSRDVPGARELLLLARLADRRIDAAEIAAELAELTTGDKSSAEGANDGMQSESAVLALAAAASRHEGLRTVSEELLGSLVTAAEGGSSPVLLSFLRAAHATVIQLNHGESGPEVLQQNRLKYWIPVASATAAESAAGSGDAMWLVHENHVLHLSGSRNDALLCRFPLVGEFEFTCETQTGGSMGTDGGLIYGGLQYEALGSPEQLSVWDADLTLVAQRPCPFLRQEDGPTFNRISVRVTSDAAMFLANLHPMWSDEGPYESSPWIGLRSFGPNRPIFRNLQIRGTPTIPRVVELLAGDELRGWQASLHDRVNALSDDQPSSRVVEWKLAEGVLMAERSTPEQIGGASQSVLRYQRPLLEGETVRYEYFYEAGSHEVHPALGRLAFLIEPSGVRIHWITDGELEWTGLPDDNATLEPFNRRGGRSLPLVPNDWNRVEVSRSDESVTLSLNDTVIYQRPADFGGAHQFGLFRDPTSSAAKVRSVTLTGDWPQQLPEEFLENPAAASGTEDPDSNTQASNSLIGDRYLADNVQEVCRHAATLSPADRYEFLASWVLPSATHADFRLASRFTSTDPVGSNFPRELTAAGFGPVYPSEGGELVSPVFDLLAAAAQLERLDQLQATIEQVQDRPDPMWRRAKDALLALIALERNDPKTVSEACFRLQASVREAETVTPHELWPETLVVFWGVRNFPANEAVGELLMTLYQHRTKQLVPKGVEWWHTQIASLKSLYEHQLLGGTTATFDAQAGLEEWIPVVRERAQSRGNGSAPVRWHRNDDAEVLHLAGHQEEALFYRSPLRGRFEVEADMVSWGTAQFVAAGLFIGPKGGRDELEMGTFRRGSTTLKPIPQMSKFDRWMRVRAVFRDDRCSLFLNGRLVHELAVTDHTDPWIGFRSWWRNEAGFRDVRISGQPVVPASISISEQQNLDGWVTYHDEATSEHGSEWWLSPQSGGAEILANRADALAGSYFENLLRWQRPLLEDGSVEYEFYYEPGKVLAHPALDRLAFLITPKGVRLHWITDGKHDTTGVRPDNRGPVTDLSRQESVLIPNQWNRLRLSLSGDTARIEINGVEVYQRALEKSNSRTFGLFHFTDQTQARVRSIVVRGDWPRTIPPVSDQDLADDFVTVLNADRARLRSVFRHEFAKSDLPERFFRVLAQDPRGIIPQSDGMRAHVSSPGNWSQVAVAPRFSLHGDFDLEARFEQTEFICEDDETGIHVTAHLQDTDSRQVRTVRSELPGGVQILKGQLSIQHPDGTRSYLDDRISDESTSGTLRLARRGNKIYHLFAQGDSDQYRLVGEHAASAADVAAEGVRLVAHANGGGSTSTLWKALTLRAERMTLAPASDQQGVRELVVVSADGSGLRTLAQAAPRFTHLGSAEWSADSSKIALDMSNGSTTTSHIIVLDADGSNQRDLGPGCMPSFSPDGKQIVFSQPGEGVVVMDADGSDRRVVDRSGWGVQWSPRGDSIAYAKGGNVVIRDMSTQRQRLLLQGEDAQRFGYIYWNLTWSRDGRFIAFKGQHRRTQMYELGVAETEPRGGLRILYSTRGSLNAGFAWSPDDQSVLFTMHSPLHGMPKLFRVSRDAGRAPELFPTQPDDCKILDCAWSPDGQSLALSIESVPQPVEWLPAHGQ